MSGIQVVGTFLTILVTALLTTLLTTLFTRRQERNRVRRPIRMEMEDITDQCRSLTENEEAKTVYTPPKNLSYDSYENNRSNLGILTEPEIEHIQRYYEKVEELHRRMESGEHRYDHVKILTDQIIHEHNEIHDYLAGGTLYRLKKQLFGDG